MRKRYWLVSVLVVTCLGGSLTAWQVFGRTPRRIDLQACDEIQFGMRESEVINLLGGPADSACDGCACGLGGCEPIVIKYWKGEDGFIEVIFDSKRTAVTSRFRKGTVPAVQISFVQYLQRAFGFD